MAAPTRKPATTNQPIAVRRARPSDREAVLSFASRTWDCWDHIPDDALVFGDMPARVAVAPRIGSPVRIGSPARVAVAPRIESPPQIGASR